MTTSDNTDEYAPFAPIYDTLVGPFVLPIRREICRIAESFRFQNIVDLCCGTGQQCIMLYRLGFCVTGVDLSPHMLRVARKASPPSIPYYQEDASRLHFEDRSFDCVIVSFALHEKDPTTRSGIIGEAKRILTDDGRILIVDYLSPMDFPARLSNACISVVEWIAGRKHYRHFRDYMKTGALNGLLKEHGLSACLAKKYHMNATALVVTRKSQQHPLGSAEG